MIVALPNQKSGASKTTLALHRAGHWARHGKRETLIDADRQRSALGWSEQRARSPHSPPNPNGSRNDRAARTAASHPRAREFPDIDGGKS